MFNLKANNVGGVPNSLHYGTLNVGRCLNSLLPPSLTMILKANNVGGVPDSLHYGTLNVGGCLDIGSTITGTGGGGCVDTGQRQPYMYQQQKGTTTSGNGQFENWGDNSAMADNSQQTDTSTDVDTNDKNHLHGVQHGALMVVDSTERAKERTIGDQKIIWDLQNSLAGLLLGVFSDTIQCS